MFKIGFSLIAGFVLLVIQSFIVMKWNGYSSIAFNNTFDIFTIWVINFFLVYAITFDQKIRFWQKDTSQ
ncbi:hypothetical protein L1765_05725 [Microaerobacter geothermalis]|uniref:hypothetical protein n=1 Tax=Microaerobacter geothermalis TaxID=674972 RepID=UPI001F3C8AE4|nr:hypothetical protein [Microaerobacter geothermalis]MCF6093485.1 hypothetical protein [Microaerobacter geothermalis]